MAEQPPSYVQPNPYYVRLVTTRQVPHRCPVCGGSGTVDHNFYSHLTSGTSVEREECRSCNGRGVIYTTETITNA